MRTKAKVTVVLELSIDELNVIYTALARGKDTMEKAELQLAKKIANQLETELHYG